MLTLGADERRRVVAACVRALPDEGCGVLLGTPEGRVSEVVVSPNAARSARVYEVDPTVLLRAYRRAAERGVEVIGVFHSHTHTPARPSATDVERAPDPAWHYVLVSLEEAPASVRSFRIRAGEAVEEPILEGSGGTTSPPAVNVD